jgi:predicted esterase
MTFIGRRVRIWINASATNPGPVIFYWHGTGMNPTAEMPLGLGPGLQDVVNAGGIVAGFYSEPALACAGCAPGSIEALGTGNAVWFKKDFETADEVLACAIQQGRANTRHLHAAGMSAGGLQASAMAYERSNYLASVISYSGGKIFPVTRQDESNTLPIVLTHGGTTDAVIVNFKTQSELMADELKPLGHFIVMCDHGRGHWWPEEFGAGGAAVQFFRAHPYKVSPEPWAGGLPASMPSYCRIY